MTEFARVVFAVAMAGLPILLLLSTATGAEMVRRYVNDCRRWYAERGGPLGHGPWDQA